MTEKVLDGLTGLPTYRIFHQEFPMKLKEAGEDARPLSLLLVDGDQFKTLNDRFGHAAGDEVLRRLATHLKETVGGRGRVYRYGGEEFAILLDGLEKEEAFLLAEQLRSGFDGCFTFDGSDGSETVTFTFSGGLSSFPVDDSEPHELLRRADEALYRAKVQGRNRICLARDEKMVTKTSYYTQGQLMRLSKLAARMGVGESIILREALDDIFKKYKLLD